MESEALKHRWVPVMPSLEPFNVMRGRPKKPLTLLESRRVQFFYFARNAIFHAAKALGLAGTEVLVPAYHHGVEIEALMAAGIQPRFYRVDENWNVDLGDLARRIHSNTRAIYLTHYAGFPGPTLQVRELAKQHGLLLLEDCTLSLLSRDEQSELGSLGDVAFFSLYKTLPVPHGGALLDNSGRLGPPAQTKAPPWRTTTKHLVSCLLAGVDKRAIQRIIDAVRPVASKVHVPTGSRHFDRKNANLAMSAMTFQLLERMSAPEIIEKRRRHFLFLLGQLVDTPLPLKRQLPDGVCPLFFPIQVGNKSHAREFLLQHGVETIEFWNHFHPACDFREFPEAVRLRKSILEIPCHQGLDHDHLRHVSNVLRNLLSKKEFLHADVRKSNSMRRPSLAAHSDRRHSLSSGIRSVGTRVE